MSDQDKQAVPEQAEGTAPAPASSATQSPTAVPQAQEQASQTGQDAKPVTAQDLTALREELRREIQSQVDKRDARVSRRMTEIDSAVALLRGQGTDISDDQVKTMKQKAATEAMTEPAQKTIEAQPADPLDVSKWEASNPYTPLAKRLMAKKQLTLDKGDPEAKMIRYDSDGATWYESFEAALDAKAARLQSAPKPEEKSKSTPAARIPAGGSSSEAPVRSASELWDKAYSKRA